MIRHGIGERIEDKVDNTDRNQLLLLERHQFAYQQVIPQVREKRILEIGCGTAYGTTLLAEYVDEIIALDTDPQLIAHLAKKQTVHTTYQAYDGTTLPFPNDSFDAIISFQVIEHVDDDVTFLDEIKRVLRVKGRAYLTTPNRLLRLLPEQRPFNHYHIREYTPQELKTLARRAGFKVRLEGIVGDSPTQALEIKRLRVYRHWLFRNVIQELPLSLQKLLAKTLRFCFLPKVSKRKQQSAQFRFYRVREVDEEGIDQCIDLWLDLEKEST
jgi:SAM-dependent methyltransferase